MFAETISVRSRRPLSKTAVFSLLFHGAAALVFIGYSSWNLQKLTPGEPPVFSFSVLEAPPGEPDKPPGAIKKTAGAAVKKADDTPKQPSDAVAAVDVVPVAGVDGPAEPGDGGDGGDELVPGGGGGGSPFGSVDAPGVAPPPPAPTPAPEMVDNSLMEGLRIAGSSQLVLPSALLSSLRAQGVGEVNVTARICVDQSGAVSKVTLSSRPDHDEVEAVVRAGVSEWRYQPFRSRGAAVPACFGKTFRYKIVD